MFLATDIMLERSVAIKTLRADLSDTAEQDETTQRFQREARTMATLQHPNIVAVHDAGWEKNQFYIVMEHIEGQNLKEILATRERLPPDEAIKIIIQVCQGLEVAHKAGLVHRDIKPANLLIKPDGSVKIMDFGIAHTLASDLTATAQVIGTPNYISPEQIQTPKDVDPRSDLFALGAVLHEMLTGEKAFAGKGFSSISWKIVHEHPTPVSRIFASIPAGMDAILGKCLAKSPQDRYPSCSALARDLEMVLQGGTAWHSPAQPAVADKTDNNHIFQEINYFHRDNIQDPLITGDTSFALNLISVGVSTFLIAMRVTRRQTEFINRIGPQLSLSLEWTPIPLATGWYRIGFRLYLLGIGLLIADLLLLFLKEGVLPEFAKNQFFLISLFVISQSIMISGVAILQFWTWSRAMRIDTFKRNGSDRFGTSWPAIWQTTEEQLDVYANKLFPWTYIPLVWMACTQIIIFSIINNVFISEAHILSFLHHSGPPALIGLTILAGLMYGIVLAINNGAIIRTLNYCANKTKRISTKLLSIAAYGCAILWGAALFLVHQKQFFEMLGR